MSAARPTTAEPARHVVEALLERLDTKHDPKQLWKNLKKLSALPITAAMLAETRVAKTVRRLRKYERVGILARDLVARWKAVVRAGRGAEPDVRGSEKRDSRKRPREALQEGPEAAEQDGGQASGGRAGEAQHPRKKQRQERRGRHGERQRGSPQRSEPANEDTPGHRPREDTRPPAARGEEAASAVSLRSRGAFSGTHPPTPSPLVAESAPSSDAESEAGDGRGVWGLSPPTQEASEGLLPKTPMRCRPEKSQSSTTRQHLDRIDEGKGAGDPRRKIKAVSNNLKTQEGQRKSLTVASKSMGVLPEVEDSDTEEEFEPPTMSFESYLNYDQPRETKKTSATARAKKSLNKKESKNTSENLNLVPELPKVKENKSERLQSSGTNLIKLEKFPNDTTSVFPELPSSREQTSYHAPLPAFEVMSSFRPKQKPLFSSQEEEEDGFIGCRVNSKMKVFSGSKGACVPKIMTLRQQCIQVLKNNVNSIIKLRGIPYSVLEPILESCTPDQLYRIEKYNKELTEETDKLWKVHCHQKFKKERPKEHESWREMYLRLQDIQDKWLQDLAMNIQSVHANKPKGRQTKVIFFNSMAEPQEKFEISRAAIPGNTKINPAPFSSASGPSLNPITQKLAYGRPSTRSAQRVVSSKKKVKKIAPIMAKSIKDYKNRFYRR